MALRLHMTNVKFDFFKYNGKALAKFETFEDRNDRYYYDKVSKHSSPFELLLSNVVVNPNLWVGDIISEQGLERWMDYVRRNESLTYRFEQDIKELDENDVKSAFVVENAQLPTVIVLFMQNRITFETLCLLTQLTGVFRYWTKELSLNFMSEDILFRIERYTPFIRCDSSKIEQIFARRFFKN